MNTEDMNKETLFLRVDVKEYSINVQDVVYIERVKTIIRVLLSDATVLELKYASLAKILQEVQSNRLVLCNRSTIVNRDYIYAVDPANRYVTLRNNRGRLDLGAGFKEGIMTELAKGEEEFLLRLDNIRYVIRVDDFLYAKSSKRVLHIVLCDGREFLISQKPIWYILQQVDTDKLMRCGRGVLVNREYIEAVDMKRRKLLLLNGEWLGIGSQYLKQNLGKNKR